MGVNELGARIGQVAAALLLLSVVHRWAAAAYGERAGAYALVSLLSAPLFFALARSLAADLLLTLFVVAAADAARRGTRPGGSRGWIVLSWAAVGAGFLTKGHVVLLWTALPALGWTLWTGRWRRLFRLADPLGIAVFAAVALPWYLTQVQRHPELIDFWLGRQTAGRVASAYDGEGSPWWNHLVTLGWSAWLWIVPGLLGLVQALRRKPRRDAPFVAFWIILPLVAFSLFPTKRMNYMLPALPALALTAGAWWSGSTTRQLRRVGGGLGAVTIAFGIGLLGATLRVDLPPPLVSLAVFLGPIFILGGAAAVRAALWGRHDLSFVGCLIPLLGLYLGLYATLSHPAVEGMMKTARPLAMAARDHPAGIDAVVTYRDWLRGLPFYLNHRLVTITDEGRETRFEEDDEWREWVYTDEEKFYSFYEDDRPRLFVIRRSDREKIEARVGSLNVLAQTRRHLLVANPAANRFSRTRARRAVPRPCRRSDRSRGAPSRGLLRRSPLRIPPSRAEVLEKS
jgi:4-amino-4-deoxy-L-arabinose transferase